LANRIRQIEEKVEPILVALKQINVEEAAREAKVPASTLRYDLGKMKKRLPDLLLNEKPGPKAKMQESKTPEVPAKREKCPVCGGKLNKNGTYWVLNWVMMLLMGWLGVQRIQVQRWRCKECGTEVADAERIRQAIARKAWWQMVNRVIALSRFKLGLSERKTQLLIGFTYAKQVSKAHIGRVTLDIGQRAESVLDRLNQCKQGAARFLLYDETFPKLEKRAHRLGVAVCEHGLIRSVRCLTNRAKEIPTQLRETVGGHFQPTYLLTDLDVTYTLYMRRAGLKLTHLRDVVHLIRQIVRLFEDAVRDVTLNYPKALPLKERKRQRKLKQRLLQKQLQPLLDRVFYAFSSGQESLCTLILEGVISMLQDPDIVIQTASVQQLTKRFQRFIKKHGDSIDQLLQLAVEQQTPKTTNLLESKNSIFKPFSRIAKFFPLPLACQAFFSAIALMENFDVKSRGINRGTSAMQRAQIDLQTLGGADFFSLVGLPPPQISLASLTE
jgi:hypothetical protein